MSVKKSKSRVSKKSIAKKSSHGKLAIILGVLLVVVIAVAGVIYYRESQAGSARIVSSTKTTVKSATSPGYQLPTGTFTADNCSTFCTYVAAGSYNSGAKKWKRLGDGKCAVVAKRGNVGYGFKDSRPQDSLVLVKGDDITIYLTDNCT